MERFRPLSEGSPILGLPKHEMPCHALPVRRTLILPLAIGMACAALVAGCSAPSAPEAGNRLETAPAVTTAVPATTTPPVETAAPTTLAATATVVPAFIPPSTTLPDDPDLREAIRVRIAVEAEYRRQDRARNRRPHTASKASRDPDTWLPTSRDRLELTSSLAEGVEAGSIDGLVVLAARFQSE